MYVFALELFELPLQNTTVAVVVNCFRPFFVEILSELINYYFVISEMQSSRRLQCDEHLILGVSVE